ncbi:hypothetical protein B9Z19DRAFT_1077884 [Tuber borchii]|uniref:Uncharacterized protein n=1 Tax=Tuber borchii TaxID=42251 RepID=A0A2T7A059_TUBBO|nr:hypothetical protein B9Z19DRAFT_1077884 [Tuber borchii]
MDAGGPSTAAGSYNAGSPSESSATTIHPSQTIRTNTDKIEILYDCLLTMLTEDWEARWDAAIKLNAVINREKKKEKGKGKEKEDGNIFTPTITDAAPNAAQVPTQHVAHQTPLRPLGIVGRPPPSPNMRRKITTADEVNTPHASPCEVLQSSRRRSMRIIGSAQKPENDKFAVIATAQEEEFALTSPAEGTVQGFRSQMASKTEAKARDERGKYVKTESTILKPRAGAGVMKRTAVTSFRSGIVEKAKAKGGMEKGTDSQSIIPTTAIEEAMEPPFTETSPEVLHGQRRRSMRIIESIEKSAQEKGESTAAGLAKGKEIVGGGSRGKIAVEVAINVESPILKPKAGAGISKRRVGASK